MGIFGKELFKAMFDADGDGRLEADEMFMRDMFVIEEILPEDERRKIKGKSSIDDNPMINKGFFGFVNPAHKNVKIG